MMKLIYFYCILSSALLIAVNAHICIIHPRQRGKFNISTAGNPSCFRHGEPCGGQTYGKIAEHIKPGTTFFVKWQQNYNHYRIGYPGYMDVAYANGNDSQSFIVVAVVMDFYAYAQGNQRNYTVPITIPNITCSHCVIRLRYNSHKPGEQTFIQCADVSFTKSKTDVMTKKEDSSWKAVYDDWKEWQSVQLSLPRQASRYLHFATVLSKRFASSASGHYIYGLSASPFDFGATDYVRLDVASGEITKLSTLKVSITNPHRIYKAKQVVDYITVQTFCYVTRTKTLYNLIHDKGNPDIIPQTIIAVDSSSGKLKMKAPLSKVATGIASIDTIMDDGEGGFITLQTAKLKNKPGNFIFVISRMTLSPQIFQPIINSAPESLYVNFLWSTIDTKNKICYLLMGNENSADKLLSRLYVVHYGNQPNIEVIHLNTSHYSIGAIHFYKKTGELLAVSPGVAPRIDFRRSPPWHLVSINPKTGTITKKFQVAPGGAFKPVFSGNVKSIDHINNKFYYRFEILDEPADLIASIDLQSHKVFYSQVGYFRHIVNLFSNVE